MVTLFIPRDIWMLAIATGHLQAAFLQTSNPLVFSQLLLTRYHINMFLKASREAKEHGN